MSFLKYNKTSFKLIGLALISVLSVEQVIAGNEVKIIRANALIFTNARQENVLLASWKSTGYKREVNSAEAIWENDPKVQFTFVNIIIQVAVQVATRIAQAIAKIKQREMIREIVKKMALTSKGLSANATSGTQAARVAKLMELPDVDYQLYLKASLEVAEARKLTEENLKSAAELREAAAREYDEAAERLFIYTNERLGEDYKVKDKKLLIESVTEDFNAYVKDLSETSKTFNNINEFLNSREKEWNQTASSFSNSSFTSAESITAGAIERVSKEQFAANAESIKADAEAQQQAANATQAFTAAGDDYIKYMEDKKLNEHPVGDAKADELLKKMQTLAEALKDPYAKIEQTSAAVNTTLSKALTTGGDAAK